ncbi:MAG: hypothetical protein RLZZ453_115 [Chlamydiota bacterium]|jgi:UDPglucose 6-dehydrogenase
MKILIVGTGYVGLVTATCFAEMGHHVLCLDVDEKKIELLKKGIMPFYEPGLAELVLRNQAAGRLLFTTDYQEGVSFGTMCFLALPTPSLESGACDTSYLKRAVESICPYLNEYKVIINKSTSPVGTTEEMQKWMEGYDVDIVSNPEFLKEGSAISDCLKPDRIIIGSNSERATHLMKELYAPFSLSRDKILVMNPASAELSKYAANAMLALRISFMNEMATLCEKLGANIKEVRKGIGSDSRIGLQFLYAGAGYGGSCFPKDIKALRHLSSSLILDAVEKVNEKQKLLLFNKLHAFFASQGGLEGKRIGLLGLSFKPDTDDMREAPSITLVKALLNAGAYIQAYDPIAIPNAKKVLPAHPHLSFSQNEYEAAAYADALVLITEWKQFRSIDFKAILPLMKQPVFFDGRNQYDEEEMYKLGFYYSGIGTPASSPSFVS